MFLDRVKQARFFVARSCRALASNNSANVAIVFGLAAPVLFGAVGAAVDYSATVATRAKMQSVADSAAIAAAREFQMAKATRDTVAAVARNYVKDRLTDVAVTPTVDDKALTVRVVLEKDVALTIGRLLWDGNVHVRTSATAKLSATLPLCLLALDEKAPATVELEQSAMMTATGCMVYSNSTSAGGLQAQNEAVLTAGLICTAGGKATTAGAHLKPDPVLDCPKMDDPLASRAPPGDSTCTFTDMVIRGGTEVLRPGVYCNGLKITNGAEVTLARGIYTIKDGPLIVDRGGTMQGTDVAIYLKGRRANLTFATASTISLSAPKDGPLAGILIFDDPTGAPALAIPPFPLPIPLIGALLGGDRPPREHKILSDNARLLLGTIYMPQGRLIIDATKPIADKSAYTVLVVRRIDLHDGPNLVLNSDYSATEVPVPKGVGPVGQVSLTN
ncbi:MAG: TadE/TadG family type IV pilus assembly protein [Xanthobacteraceae bacterium]